MNADVFVCPLPDDCPPGAYFVGIDARGCSLGCQSLPVAPTKRQITGAVDFFLLLVTLWLGSFAVGFICGRADERARRGEAAR